MNALLPHRVSLPDATSPPRGSVRGAAHPDRQLERVAEWFRQRRPGSAIGDGLHVDQWGTYAQFGGLRLRSVFQPLLHADGLQPAAHEALLRVTDEHEARLSPADAFKRSGTPSETVYLDRLCRMLHVLNFVRQSSGQDDLYLNVHGGHLMGVAGGGHGRTFETLLRHCGLRPQNVVLEIIEAGIDDIGRLSEALDAYRARGYRVAIDDFGCLHSNFDRLWRLSPDIVKLDRSLVVQAMHNLRARRMLPGLVALIHDLDAQVVCEGIETDAQHQLAVDAGADLLQGFLYARPDSRLLRSAAGTQWVGG